MLRAYLVSFRCRKHELQAIAWLQRHIYIQWFSLLHFLNQVIDLLYFAIALCISNCKNYFLFNQLVEYFEDKFPAFLCSFISISYWRIINISTSGRWVIKFHSSKFIFSQIYQSQRKSWYIKRLEW